MKRVGTALLVVLFFTSILLSGTQRPAEANSELTWTDGSDLEIDVSDDYADVESLIDRSQDCFPTTFKVKIYSHRRDIPQEATSSPEEKSVCAVQTPFGLISKSGYVKFSGSEYAQKIDIVGASRVKPIPGQSTVYAGGGLNRYDGNSPYKAYFIDDLPYIGEHIIHGEATYRVNFEPDYLTDEEGEIIGVSNHAFSKNGEWMIARVKRVIMRVHIPTMSMQTIAKASTNNGTNYKLAISNDGQFAFSQYVSRNDGGTPFVYDLASCEPSDALEIDVDTSPGCGVRNLRLTLRDKIPDFNFLTFIHFSHDGQKIMALSRIEDSLQKYTEIYRSDYVKPDKEYIALGDSFSSGEGAGSYEDYSNNDENTCRISQRSYPYILAEQLGIHEGPERTPQTDGIFNSVACSGAKLDNVNGFLPQINLMQDPGFDNHIMTNFLPGYRPQINFPAAYSPAASTITIGGNDIGFGNKLSRCIGSPTTCFSSYESRVEVFTEIDRQFNQMYMTLFRLKQTSPDTRYYVVGYPQIAAATDNDQCALNVELNQQEREFARGIVSYLNKTIRVAATQTGLLYVDVEDAFHGRQLCDGPSSELAVHGVTAGRDKLQVLSNASYHPTDIGQRLLAQRILEETDSLTKEMPEPFLFAARPSMTDDEFLQYLIDAPVIGAQIRSNGYVDDLFDDIIYFGETHLTRITSLMPNTAYGLQLFSDPVHLGDFTTDSKGNLDIEFTLPEDIEPGFHTFHLNGPTLGGEDISRYKTVYIAHSEDDFDGDGVPNDQDSCLVFEPSGVDYDQDGIDDACDGFIDEPPEEPVEDDPPEESPEVHPAIKAIRSIKHKLRRAFELVLGNLTDNLGEHPARANRKGKPTDESQHPAQSRRSINKPHTTPKFFWHPRF
ncbi:MAG: SGNH/GDSL hydrolase family protein [Candidatus Saccharibacteria bacterium]|nr:SGNH/GDSL hydrolase family protein [Candidatus Saccharibacteria bacterium]